MKNYLIAKRDALLANRKNKNKGFTLVELVVVIVILAILIGVTIGGVYTYVGQSRTNTDVNNAASIQSALSVLGADEDVYAWAKGNSPTAITIKWKDKVLASTMTGKGTTIGTKKLGDIVSSILTDGLPASQTKSGFTLTLTPDGEGNVSIACKAECDGGTDIADNAVDVSALTGN